MDNKNKSKIIQVRISEGEAKMLEEVCEKWSTRTSEYIRALIRDAHRRTFPAYAAKSARPISEDEPELTPEQACEQAGGKIETHEGIQMCVFQISKSMKRKVPLSMPEKFK